MFISILYMFRATMCSSSGESVVSIRRRHMSLYVGDRVVCRYKSNCCSIHTCILHGHLRRVTNARRRIDTTDSPDDEQMVARNMWSIEVNIYWKELCVKLVIYKNSVLRLFYLWNVFLFLNNCIWLTHWGRVTQICVFNTRLFSLRNTLNYAIHRACLRMVLLTDVYRNLTSLWINF